MRIGPTDVYMFTLLNERAYFVKQKLLRCAFYDH